MRLLARLLGVRRRTPRPTPPIDAERLQRIYRETHRVVEELRKAA